MTEEEILQNAQLLLVIFNLIKEDGIFRELKEKYEALKKENDDYYNCHLLITLLKKHLLIVEYENEQNIERNLKIYNMSLKLNFTFTVTKITINNKNTSAIDKIKGFIEEQKNINFDGEIYTKSVREFISNMSKSSEIEIVDIYYQNLYFISKYVAHVKIPNNYNEVKSFLKNYGYFIYGKDGDTYYILHGVKEGKTLNLHEFKRQKAQELYLKFILLLLKKTSYTINGKKVMDILDKEIAKNIFVEN